MHTTSPVNPICCAQEIPSTKQSAVWVCAHNHPHHQTLSLYVHKEFLHQSKQLQIKTPERALGEGELQS
jgi:hypothetical protein